MIIGRAGLGVVLKEDVLTDERVIGTEDGLCTLFFPEPAKGPSSLLIRSAEMPSSTIEFTDIALVAEEPSRRVGALA